MSCQMMLQRNRGGLTPYKTWTSQPERHWLWRGVDQDGHVLDEIVQVRRDINTARGPLIRLLHDQDVRTGVGGQR